MKKFLFFLLACAVCSTLQSCLEFDEPGDELGYGQILNPDTSNGGQDGDGTKK